LMLLAVDSERRHWGLLVWTSAVRCYKCPSRHGLDASCVRTDQTLGEHKMFEAPI
jgi:hypothetical protein